MALNIFVDWLNWCQDFPWWNIGNPAIFRLLIPGLNESRHCLMHFQSTFVCRLGGVYAIKSVSWSLNFPKDRLFYFLLESFEQVTKYKRKIPSSFPANSGLGFHTKFCLIFFNGRKELYLPLKEIKIVDDSGRILIENWRTIICWLRGRDRSTIF